MTFEFSEAARQVLGSSGPALVLGGPGSGKTTLSLLKAQGLIPSLAPGQEVLFLSFSRAAVHQVSVRCKDVLSSEERGLIAVKTYHAFCMDILRAHGRLLTASQPRILFPRDERLRSAAHDGDWAEERKRLATEEGLFAFDEFASRGAELLARAACVRTLIADRYPIIILDEFQDTNDAQWALVQQLALGSRLIVLADPDQRIFEYDSSVDPLRLDQLRDTLAPSEFDLGTENHRSPGGGILGFADAVLRNRPLPDVREVVCRSYSPRNLDGTVHAAVVWLLGGLREPGVTNPSVAVLCRTNSLVLRMSEALAKERTYKGAAYRPVEHAVAWDAGLSAAAAVVVASILEWPAEGSDLAAPNTLDAIANFYDTKNSLKTSKAATSTAASFRNAVERTNEGKEPRSQAGKTIVAAHRAGVAYTGSPVQDWKCALAVLEGAGQLLEIQRHSRLVRLFRASGEIGPQLAEQWLKSDSYKGAREIVRRAIDQATLSSVRSDPRGVVLMTMHKSRARSSTV
ncbi:MAG TPA: UvrD-helicase domain-containing protein [Solirubrobacterales bacterium]